MIKHTYQKSVARPEALRVGLLWISFMLSSTSAFGLDEYLEKSFFLQQLRVQVASKAFAERVALPPDSTIEELPKGLFALEFLVERGEGSSALYCGLKIYFDNSLRPYTPSNSLAGSLLMIRSPTHYFFRNVPGDTAGRAKWSERDRVFRNTKDTEFLRSAAISSEDYVFRNKGTFEDPVIKEFHREILPGVAYVMLLPSCNLMEHTEPNTKKWKLWIKRETAPDYRQIMKMDEKEFIVFEMPRSFLERIRPMAARASAYTRANLGQMKQGDR